MFKKVHTDLVYNVTSLPQTVRPFAQAGNKNLELSPLALFAFFVTRCRENLHIVVAFSPIGDAFRNRLRQFPSLINCCTIDWFQVCNFCVYVILRSSLFVNQRWNLKECKQRRWRYFYSFLGFGIFVNEKKMGFILLVQYHLYWSTLSGAETIGLSLQHLFSFLVDIYVESPSQGKVWNACAKKTQWRRFCF